MLRYTRPTALCIAFFITLNMLLLCGCTDKNTDNKVSDTEALSQDAADPVSSDTPDTAQTTADETDAVSSVLASASPVAQPSVSEAPATEAPAAEAPPADTAAAVTDYVPVEPAAATVFDNSLFIGDSRTLGLGQYADLGSADVFAASGLNVLRVFSERINVKGFGETDLASLLSKKKYDRVYIMLGLNEIGYDHGFIIRKYGDMLTELRSRCGDAKLIVCANLHIIQRRSASDGVYNNRALDELNSGMKGLADGAGMAYIDINPIFDDADGALSEAYTVDDFHLKAKYYAQWGQWLAAQPV